MTIISILQLRKLHPRDILTNVAQVTVLRNGRAGIQTSVCVLGQALNLSVLMPVCPNHAAGQKKEDQLKRRLLKLCRNQWAGGHRSRVVKERAGAGLDGQAEGV